LKTPFLRFQGGATSPISFDFEVNDLDGDEFHIEVGGHHPDFLHGRKTGEFSISRSSIETPDLRQGGHSPSASELPSIRSADKYDQNPTEDAERAECKHLVCLGRDFSVGRPNQRENTRLYLARRLGKIKFTSIVIPVLLKG
jgi:hypothetical protein